VPARQPEADRQQASHQLVPLQQQQPSTGKLQDALSAPCEGGGS